MYETGSASQRVEEKLGTCVSLPNFLEEITVYSWVVLRDKNMLHDKTCEKYLQFNTLSSFCMIVVESFYMAGIFKNRKILLFWITSKASRLEKQLL